MMRPMGMARILGVLLTAVFAGSGCAPAAEPYAAPRPVDCRKDRLSTLYAGVFTFGTDQPVYPPWYIGDDPANGEGFESALAYTVAGRLGYAAEDVRWVRVPFSEAITPGPKMFDATLSQFSITEQREAAVDFSSPYFDVTQAVVTVRSSPAADARNLNDLKALRLGAQVGTTSQGAAASVGGDAPVVAYNTNGDAKLGLGSGEIDALVADLPTAYSVATELKDGLIVGQLPSGAGDSEQFGVVLHKGSSLTRCVSSIVDALRDDGTLGRLESTWLADAGNVAVLT